MDFLWNSTFSSDLLANILEQKLKYWKAMSDDILFLYCFPHSEAGTLQLMESLPAYIQQAAAAKAIG